MPLDCYEMGVFSRTTLPSTCTKDNKTYMLPLLEPLKPAVREKAKSEVN